MNDRHDERQHDATREPSRDQLLVQRYADGELRPTESAALEGRLLKEPGLVRELERVVQARGPFQAQAEEPVPLGAGFADRVFAELRGAPKPSAQDVPEPLAAEVPAAPGLERTLRIWALVAASLLLLLGAFALFSGGERRPGTMMADDSSAERARTLRELDARARELETEAPRLQER